MTNKKKNRCVSVLGVELWKGLDDVLKLCSSLLCFQKKLKRKISHGYGATDKM